ncbi:baseplate assembly protein [Escherichia coli]|uniref:baseplate assembly protein n=1 Tax=Escherichia coli TaxID=562 RepID=UPI0010E04F83|nr:baseplate J/gp47 family protein [Escherichia coli]GDO99340.1 phage baseplate assembly protein [Escherichia coli]
MALKEPDFIERDAGKITAEMIAWYEEKTGKTLYPAQAERLLIDLWSYREMLYRVAVQEAAKQNLVAFSRAPMLDYLGELVGVHRLSAQPATTTLRFQVDTPPERDVFIPAGTRVSASDSIVFTTDTDVLLKTGTTEVTVTATCTEPGTAGNGWQPAQISQLPEGTEGADLQVSGLHASSGGTEEEGDDRLRERIRLAPESFTCAGSRGAYRYHAMSVHPGITDVAVVRPVPGTVELYPLMTTGLPDSSLLTLVEGFCSDEKIRPLTDTVLVKTPVKVDYSIEARLTLYRNQDQSAVLAAAHQAAQQHITSLLNRLGRDIVPSQIISALSVSGVYQVELVKPALRVLTEKEWAHCTGVKLNIAGVTDG